MAERIWLPGEVVLAAWVEGKPRPKGSLDPRGGPGGYLADNNVHTDPWRRRMAEGFRAHVTQETGETRGGKAVVAPLAGYPVSGRHLAIGVRARALFSRPASTPAEQWAPVTVRTGDVDKLARCLLDALFWDAKSGKGAPVLADDAQVCDLDVKARYAPRTSFGQVGAEGLFVQVWILDPRDG